MKPRLEPHGNRDARPRLILIDGRYNGLTRPLWRAVLVASRPGPLTRRKRRALSLLRRSGVEI